MPAGPPLARATRKQEHREATRALYRVSPPHEAGQREHSVGAAELTEKTQEAGAGKNLFSKNCPPGHICAASSTVAMTVATGCQTPGKKPGLYHQSHRLGNPHRSLVSSENHVHQ